MGDDTVSYAFDGKRIKKWHNRLSIDYGKAWSAGDVIGTKIDLERGTIFYWLNDQELGCAFTDVPKIPGGYYPAISMSRQQHVIFNFGETPFFTKRNLFLGDN